MYFFNIQRIKTNTEKEIHIDLFNFWIHLHCTFDHLIISKIHIIFTLRCFFCSVFIAKVYVEVNVSDFFFLFCFEYTCYTLLFHSFFSTWGVYLNCPGAAPKSPPLCLLAALDGAKPSNFCIFCRIDMVHKIYKKINEHSV